MNLNAVLRVGLPLLGLALFAAILIEADLDAVWRGLGEVGWRGIGLVLAIHALAFLADVVLWLMSCDGLPLDLRWSARFYLVRLIGEAFNNITPFASMGGEPIKAQILKQRYDVGYTVSGVAFFITKTANLVALVVFLAIGFIAMLFDPRFAGAYSGAAAGALALFALASVLVFVLQRGRLASRLGRRFNGTRLGRRVAVPMAAIERFDDQLVDCYQRAPRRFVVVTALAFLTWVAGLLEVWVIMAAAGHPISVLDAWVVEAAAQLVRTAAFFLPAGLGAMELSFVVMIDTLSGNASVGVVVAVVRRFRDLVFIAAGIALSAAGPKRADPDQSATGPQ